MQMFLRARSMRLAPIVLGAILVLAGCSGGADSGQVPPSDNLSIPTQGGNLSIPAAGGYSGTITLPPAVAGGGARAAIQAETTQPSGTSTFGATGLYFFGLYVAATVQWATSPAFTIQLPATATAGPYYLAVYDSQNGGAGWNLTDIGPATINGSTLTFPSTNNTVQINAGDIIWFGLHT